MSIPTIKLSDAAEINPRLSARPAADAHVSFLGMADMDAESGTTTRGHARQFGEVAKGYTQFADGDLLVAKITPCFENGKIAQAKIEHSHGTGSTEFHVIRPDRSRFDDRFLLRFLRQPYIRIAGEKRMTGSAGQRRVPESYLADLLVPLIPWEEQRRIAYMLDRVDTLRAKRRETITLLDDLTKSIFFDMFGEPASNLRGMHVRTLGDIAKVKSGSFLPAVAMNPMGKYPVYGGNGINGFHDEYLFDSPRIVLGRVGVYCGCVHLSRARSWVTDNALYISEIDDSIDLIYLYHALQHANLNQYASKSAQPLISGSRIYGTKIIVPPSSLQRDLSVRVNGADSLKREHEAHLAELDALFACLQHRAFCGELWDSPAA
jgi:type I restriction enzyme, S subunit